MLLPGSLRQYESSTSHPPASWRTTKVIVYSLDPYTQRVLTFATVAPAGNFTCATSNVWGGFWLRLTRLPVSTPATGCASRSRSRPVIGQSSSRPVKALQPLGPGPGVASGLTSAATACEG